MKLPAINIDQSFEKEQRRNGSAGFTLIEILIAMAIFSIGILGVATMQISSVNGNANARKHLEASAVAQGLIESTLSIPFNNVADSDIVNADGYRVQMTIQNQSDLDADGTNDAMRILVQVFDPSGVERSRISFLKARNI
ncbi:MAG: prepilin-type N-terminal cleavage/methylation domain-containing protein [Desulfobacteraceae bacterium]|nr:prepilin-type N-terminal cleavage/methylation domain-containing protein [Desulfobacteraceae bacterium]